MGKTLNVLNIGDSAEISAINLEARAKKRLMAMGIVPGTMVIVEGFAPLGDPMQIRVKQYNLVIRRSEAEKILVK